MYYDRGEFDGSILCDWKDTGLGILVCGTEFRDTDWIESGRRSLSKQAAAWLAICTFMNHDIWDDSTMAYDGMIYAHCFY